METQTTSARPDRLLKLIPCKVSRLIDWLHSNLGTTALHAYREYIYRADINIKYYSTIIDLFLYSETFVLLEIISKTYIRDQIRRKTIYFYR